MKNLSRELKLTFSLFFIIILISLVTVTYVFVELKDDGIAINVSGSQRMRTMLISNYLQQYKLALDNKDQVSQDELYEVLKNEIDIYDDYFTSLVYGDDVLMLDQQDTEIIIEKLNEIRPLLDNYISSAKEVMTGYEQASYNYVLNNALELKDLLDELVMLYQKEYDNKINNIKRLAYLFAAIATALTIMAPFVIRNNAKHTFRKAYYDKLTSVRNRAHLFEYLEVESGEKIHLMYIDLDYFKHINDLYGHVAGDYVLKVTAKRLVDMFGNESVYRIGGDEFIVITKCKMMDSDCNSCNIPHYECKLIVDSIVIPIKNNDRNEEYMVSCSVGHANGNINEISELNSIIEYADAAMNKSKSDGSGNYRLACNEFLADYKEKVNVNNRLKTSLENNELIPYFQPIIDTASNKVEGFEVLVRWHRDGKIESPNVFLDSLINSGMIYDVDLLMLRKGIELYAKLRDMKLAGNDFIVSVNFSPYTIGKVNLNKLVEYVDELNVSRNNIQIEITEELLLEVYQKNKIDRIIDLGFKVAMDDFSSGHSSLKYIRDIRFNTIKLDRSILPYAEEDMKNDFIYRTIVNLMHELDMSIVSEGIETAQQLKLVSDLNIKYGQGYYYSKPISESDFITYIGKFNNKKIETSL